MGEFKLDTPIRVRLQWLSKPCGFSIESLIQYGMYEGKWPSVAQRHGLNALEDEFDLAEHVDVLTMQDIEDLAGTSDVKVGRVFGTHTLVSFKVKGKPRSSHPLLYVLERITTPESACKVAKRHKLFDIKRGSDLECHLHELDLEDICTLTGDPNTTID